MIEQELLQDLTESYLKSLIAEVSGSLSPDFDSFAPFGELGIDSFHVLRIIRKLEEDFGTLPKSLLFERFNISDLANYFVNKHEQTLSARFANQTQGNRSSIPGTHTNGHAKPAEKPEKTSPSAASGANRGIAEGPQRILEKDAASRPELRDLIQELSGRYKIEGSVSRGTRKIAPNLFIGCAKRGFFNYGRSRNVIVVYAYTGPRDYLPELMGEMYEYCREQNFQLNFLADEEVREVGGISVTATPFGVLQRIRNLKEFTLEGGAMRRLRYQISKFEKCGTCRTEEYRCGSDPQTDRNIAGIIDRWCETKTMVNPLVHDVKAEILAGKLPSEHRLFLTYLDDVLQNVILISSMSADEKGYLMDLEFYPPDMPMGGLEFAIVQIISLLASEGCDVLSLGGTYGCKLNSSDNADPEIDKILDNLRAQNIFNDEGNLQFKNKFRPENKSIFLCRPVGSDNPGNVIDIIMMIADPDKMQTSDCENHTFHEKRSVAAISSQTAPRPALSAPVQTRREQPAPGDCDRQRILAEHGFNPLNVPHEFVEFDLKTDSWAQLRSPAIEVQVRHLHGQLQQPVNVDECVRAVFPFSHFVFTGSGQEAEHAFFKAWLKKGTVLQNLLFPSTLFHQINNGFAPKEIPHPEVFRLDSEEMYKGNLDWAALQAEVAQNPGEIAFVCIEVGNNAAGGSPVSLQHLKDVKALLARHSIPLVIDGTRVVENAQFLIQQEQKFAGKSLWVVVQEIFSHADAVIGSLTKDFCVARGGIIATNDSKLFHRLQEAVHEDGGGIDLIDQKMIALSLQSRKQIEARVLRRMEATRLVWQALSEHNVPVVRPAGGHCILIDVKQIAEFREFRYPVASFLAWMFLNTGIRVGAHSVGMQKQTCINDLVRVAIPVGLKREQIETIIARLVMTFEEKADIAELAIESNGSQPFGAVHANYRLVQLHRASGMAAGIDCSSGEVAAKTNAAPAAASPSPAESASSAMVAAGNIPEESGTAANSNRKQLHATQDVAIVGMAGRYPRAKDMRELWANLAAGRDCVEEIPVDRYERLLQYGKVEKYRGGFMDGVDKFDSIFFNISPREAEVLDPQERLFLEVAWEAIEDAGYYPETLVQEDKSRRVGVFVGAVWTMYQMLGVEEKHAGNKIIPNSFLWSVANRVSYWMNFSGPSMTLDTACSSSLTALYLAVEAIQAGDCSAALVGGVNLDLNQAKFDINHAGGALSPDGVCRSFGKGANGYVAGEGVGALLLRPLNQAIKDGDHIYGVIKSAVVNHGGRTSGYIVPNPKAQSNLILAALKKANVGAQTIGYIEAHGTGTALGDPIEVTGLSHAFSEDQVANQSCAIGSIKSNIGHLEAAAGVVGISKVLLQMKHRQLVPSLHSAELNEFIDFANSPFYVVQKLEEWKARETSGVRLPLRAGISSFGAGGANAHVILESYESPEQAGADREPSSQQIFPLSARSEEQLREMATRLAEFLQQTDVRMADVAYTLQAGRKSFEHRVAVIARTKEELLEKLVAFISGRKTEGVIAGQSKSAEGVTRLLNRREKEEFVRLISQTRDLGKLASLWSEGLLTDWQGFQSQDGGKRISLPTYPFAGKRHWACERTASVRALQAAPAMHPLLDTNESTFERQLFRKIFSDRDFFIYDHHVAGIPTLPGVAYLELARKAGEIAAGRKVQKIRNIVWVSPIAVINSTPKEVFIELKPSEATVRFEVFSNDEKGNKVLHSQGSLVYATRQEMDAAPEYVDIASVRARCEKVTDGNAAYPMFKSVGLTLGPSFQVLQDIYKNENEILGILELPEFRRADLQSLVLQPSMVDGSLQAGMGAQLGAKTEEMYVPFSIGEVEILHPLQPNCFSYITEAKDDRKGKPGSRVVKSNVSILDETGKVLVKIRESVGVPLRELYRKPAQSESDEGFTRLYYSYDWEKAPLAREKASSGGPTAIVLFDSDEKLRDQYQAGLKEAGDNSDHVILVRPGTNFQDLGDRVYAVNPQNKDDFAQLFAVLLEKQCPVENLCFAWPLGDAPGGNEDVVEASLKRGPYAFLYLCQALIRHKLDNKVQLLYLHASRAGESLPYDEAMRGFVNAVRLEHPKLICKTVEIMREGDGCAQVLDAIKAELLARTTDAAAVRYEGEERLIRKLKALDPEKDEHSSSQGVPLRENGVYLITGGAGGLGLIFAEFLAREYKARLVLTGRSALSAPIEAKLEELKKSGGEILYLSADISNLEDAGRVVAESKKRFGGIHGVIHAAGVLRDSLLRNKTLAEMSAVLAPKVHGTIYLDELTKNEALDFFTAFSSLAAVAGNAGQCDYSYANHFMDSFAAGRELLRARGERHGKSFSFNWSIWADGGMKLDEQGEIFFRKTLGIKPLSAATGMDAFVKGLTSEKSQFVVLEGIQDKVERAWGLRKAATPAPASSAASTRAATAPAENPSGGSRRETNVSSPAGNAAGASHLQRLITDYLAGALKMEPGAISGDAPFADYGVDSIVGVNMVSKISEALRIELDPVILFEYSTIDQLIEYIGANWQVEASSPQGRDQQAAQSQREAIQETEREPESEYRIKTKAPLAKADIEVSVTQQSTVGIRSDEPIAVIGMSGRFAESEHLDEFWNHLQEGRDLVKEVSRWSSSECVPAEPSEPGYCRHGSFVDSIDRFDPAFFRISPTEAVWMDPQQRLFLEECWRALEDAGYAGRSMSEKQCSVYVGCSSSGYENLFAGDPPSHAFWGNALSVVPARIAYYLNLQGPAMAVDTASSSSMVAVHLACQGLWTGEMEMALAGGVFLQAAPGFYRVTNRAGLLSPSGKCYSFDARANGFVPGEGVGVLVLKRLCDALRDGDHIHGVIAGSAINQNGSSNGLIAPNARAQERLELSVYGRFQIDPATIQFVEASGTGTVWGDSIEYQALSRAFGHYTEKKQFCALGAVATNIGHAAAVSGMAGILKLLLALKHRQIPPTLHFETSNPAIDFKSGPFYLNTQLKEWTVDANQPRRAAVSSFGIGGTNAHMVFEEAPAVERTAIQLPGYMVVLSARTAEQMKQQARNLLEFVKRTPGLPMDDLSYTLFVGRMHFGHRLSCVARNQEELARLLAQWVETGTANQVFTAEVQEGKTREQTSLKKFGNYCIQECRNVPDAAGYLETLATVAELYAQGYTLDFAALFPAGSRRIPLPTYPFAKEYYWADTAGTVEPSVVSEPEAVDPLQANAVTEKEQNGDAAGFTVLPEKEQPAHEPTPSPPEPLRVLKPESKSNGHHTLKEAL